MSSVVDMMVKPILMMPPFFTVPPVTSVICGIVALIKGGGIEKIPGIGILLKYARESILILLLLIVLYVKSWQYIGPKIWHWIEGGKDWAIGHLTDGEPGHSDYTMFPNIKKIIVWWGVKAFITAPLTYLLQVPIDLMAWDLESLSLDFGHKWASPSNHYRGDCSRFISGSYAGDYSLYEKETSEAYTGDTFTDTNDKYIESPNAYLCTHGNYCPEMSDVLGVTMLGQNGSLTKDKSPTNGYMNGINITSAPRKYTVCCDHFKSASEIKACPSYCNQEHPDVNFNFSSLLAAAKTMEDLATIVEHPINWITTQLDAVKDYPEDYDALLCLVHNKLYDAWNLICKNTTNKHTGDGWFTRHTIDVGEDAVSSVVSTVAKWAKLCPNDHGFYKNASGAYNGCSKSLTEILEDIPKNVANERAKCESDCTAENDSFLNGVGCNSKDMAHAKMSTIHNRVAVLKGRLSTDGDDEINEQAIKRTKWGLGERPTEPNPTNKYKAGLLEKLSASCTMKDGTDCCRDDLSNASLEKCFGHFRPMTTEQYPVLFYKITKDFMGPLLWALLGMFVLFIILYILCLFNLVGRAAYKGDHGPALDSLPKFLRNKLK